MVVDFSFVVAVMTCIELFSLILNEIGFMPPP
jgi:hypothetical protein